MKDECYGCGVCFDITHEDVCRVGIQLVKKHESTTSDEAYCPRCSKKIKDIDINFFHNNLRSEVKAAIALGVPKTSVTISEAVVREIASNLGASYRLVDALVERIFGPHWTGAPPENSGIVMNKYANRDRLVAFVAGMLKDLWTLEAQ